jgi:hypothetical protein
VARLAIKSASESTENPPLRGKITWSLLLFYLVSDLPFPAKQLAYWLRCGADHHVMKWDIHTTSLAIPVPVGSLKDLAGAAEMERIIVERSAQGVTDEIIAAELTAQGFRSPMHPFVLESTVQIIRLRHGLFQVRSQSHPRHVAGSLTLTQVAKQLDIAPHWIYDRIHNGTIQVTKDPSTRLYLFPDEPKTLKDFKRLVKGTVKKLRF